jgi:small-conductance mechanosensitive channel
MQNGAMVIKAQMRTRPSGKSNVIRAFNLRLKRAFDSRGIAMPFPQRMVQVMPAAPAGEVDTDLPPTASPAARAAARR